MKVRLTLRAHNFLSAAMCTAVASTVINAHGTWSSENVDELPHEVHEHEDSPLEQMDIQHVLGDTSREIFQIRATHTTSTWSSAASASMWGRHCTATSYSSPRPSRLTRVSGGDYSCWGIVLVDVDVELDEVLS